MNCGCIVFPREAKMEPSRCLICVNLMSRRIQKETMDSEGLGFLPRMTRTANETVSNLKRQSPTVHHRLWTNPRSDVVNRTGH